MPHGEPVHVEPQLPHAPVAGGVADDLHRRHHTIPAMTSHGIFRPPAPTNEPAKDYAPGAPERAELQKRLAELERERLDVPCVIGGGESRNGGTGEGVMRGLNGDGLAGAS